MPDRHIKATQSEVITNTGNHYYQVIASLISVKPIAASKGISLEIHIDPRIPVLSRIESKIVRQTLLPLVHQIIEESPWSRLNVSFQLCNIRDSRYYVDMTVWGNGCPLRRHEKNNSTLIQQATILNNKYKNTAKSSASRQMNGLYRQQHLATSRFEVVSSKDHTFSWQVPEPVHEAAVILSADLTLIKRIDKYLDQNQILTSHADSLTNACRMIVANNDKLTYTAILVDAQLGNLTLNKYSALLRNVASKDTKFILLTHNEINKNLIRKYQAAGYFAIVNLESETELVNAMYASSLLNTSGYTTRNSGSLR